jgi:hypothetical protein
VAAGAATALGALSSHRALDRLIAGKLWIGVVAFALIGIVTLQLGLLELNRGIGRSLERESALQRQNAALSVENSELAAGDKVEARAQTLGMELVPVGSLRFLGSNPRADIARAAAALQSPVHSVTPGNGERATAPVQQGTGAQTTEAAAAQQASSTGSSTETTQTAPVTQTPPQAQSGSEAASQAAPPQAATGTESSSGGGTQASPSG